MRTREISRSGRFDATAAFGLAAFLTFGALDAARAGPTGGVVEGGDANATITTVGDLTTIDQFNDRVRINWESFDVAQLEIVDFNQATTDVALNLIGGMTPSQIDGMITAEGHVILINPNGLVFGNTAQVNVGSLVASSLDVLTIDPVTGRYTFSTLSANPGAVTNDGSITAANNVSLLGGSVTNNGVILANLGTVNLASGSAVTLDIFGGGLLQLAVADEASVVNSSTGMITANGGTVLLTANAALGALASVVNNEGVIVANRVDTSAGVIRLVGAGEAEVTSAGSLTATDLVELTADVDVTIGSVAAEVVDITSTGGSILDDGVGSTLIAADQTSLSAATAVGTDANRIATDVSSLSVTTGAGGAFVTEANGLTSVAVSTADGDVDIGFDAGNTVTFDAATGALTFAATPTDVSFTSSGAIVLTGTNTADDLVLTAQAGTITDASDADLTVANNASFVANGVGGGVTLGDEPDNADSFGSLTFNSTGNVSISEDDDMVLTGSSTGTDMALTAAGSITGSLVSGDRLTLSASAVGGDPSVPFPPPSPLLTDVNTISADTTGAPGGVVNISNANAVTLESISTQGGRVIVQTGTGSIDATSIDTTNGAPSGNAVNLTAGLTQPDGSDASINVGSINAGTAGDVELIARGDIGGGAGHQITGRILDLRAGGDIGAGTPLNTAVDEIDARTTVGQGIVHITEADDVLLAVTTTGGEVDVTAGGDIAVAAIDTAALQIGVDPQPAGADVRLESTGGSIAGSSGVRVITAGTGGAVVLSADAAITALMLNGGSADLDATTGDIDNVQVTVAALADLDAGGNILLGSVTADIADLSAGGSITDAAGDAASIIADELTLHASAIGTDVNALNTNVNSINADTSGAAAGGVYIAEANQVSLTSVLTAGGEVDVTAAEGDIEVTSIDTTDGGAAPAGARVALTAQAGSILDDDLDATVINAGASAIALAAATNIGTVVDFGALADADVGSSIDVTTSGALSALASSDASEINLNFVGSSPTLGVGAVAIGDANLSTATAGAIVVQSAGDLDTTSWHDDAIGIGASSTSDVGLRSGAILILPAGTDVPTDGTPHTLLLSGVVDVIDADAGTDARVLDLEATNLDFRSGAAGAAVTPFRTTLNTTVDRIDASIGSSSNLVINEVDDITLGQLSLVGNGSLILDAGGAIRDDLVQSTRVAAASLTLIADGSIGAADPNADIDTSATSLSAVTSGPGGSIYINEDDGITLVQVQASGAGNDVSIRAAEGDIGFTSVSVITAPDAMTLEATSGAIVANASTTVSANSLDLSAGTAIGSAATPFNTSINTLDASAGNGGVFIRESNGLTISNVTSVAATDAASDVSVTSTTGNITVGLVSAEDAVTLTAAGGSIVGAAGGNHISGSSLTATAGGGAVGASAARLNTSVGTLTASAGNGGVFIAENDDVTLASVSSAAAAAGASIVEVTSGLNLNVGTVSAEDAVSLLSFSGSINGLPGNSITAPLFTASANGSIGSAAQPLNTDVDTFNANASAGGIFINESDGLLLDGVFSFSPAAEDSDIEVTSATGDILVGNVSALDSVALDAQTGSVLNNVGGGSVSAHSLDASAGLNVILSTQIDTLTAHAGAGNVQIFEADGLSLENVSAYTVTGSVNVISNTGDITVANVEAGAFVDLIALEGSILDDDVDDTYISSEFVGLTAGRDVGDADLGGRLDLSGTQLLFATAGRVDGANGDVIVRVTDTPALFADVIAGESGGSGNIKVDLETGDLILGRVEAAGDEAQLTAFAGNLVDGDLSRLLIADHAILRADGAIGATNGGTDGFIGTDVSTLDASAGGGLYVNEANTLSLGDVESGTEAVIIAANSVLDDGDNGTRVSTGNLVLRANGGSIGSAGATGQIDISADTLIATADQGVFVAEGGSLLLQQVEGASASITAVGNLTVGSVDVGAGAAQLSSQSAILDDGVDATRIEAGVLTLAGVSVGAAGAGQMDTDVTSLDASASAGGIFIAEADGLELRSISAAGAGNGININAGGAITDDGNAATRVVGGALSLTGTSIGASTATGQIDTTVASLNAVASNGGVFVGEADGVQLLSVSASGTNNVGIVAGGAITDDGVAGTRVVGNLVILSGASIGAAGAAAIDTTAVTLDATATNGGVFISETNDLTLTATATNGVTVETLGSNITLSGTVAGGSGDVTLTAGPAGGHGGIFANAGSQITGNALNVTGSTIGRANARLNTSVATLDATSTGATAGDGIFVTDANALTVTNAQAGGGIVNIATTAGNLTVGTISGTATDLNAGGAILQGTGSGIATGALALSGNSIGTGAARVRTAASTLTAAASNGGVFIDEANALTISGITANGASGHIEVLNATGDLTVNSVDADGRVLLASGGSILAGSSDPTITANALEIRIGAASPAGSRVAATNALITVEGITAAPRVFVPVQASGTAIGLRLPGDLENNQIVYAAPDALAVQLGFNDFLTDTVGQFIPQFSTQAGTVIAESTKAAEESVLYVDWGSFDPNVSLFGTMNPPICLPSDQREEDDGQSGCLQGAAPTARAEQPPNPARSAIVYTRDGWRVVKAFYTGSVN